MTAKSQGGDAPRKTVFVESLEVDSTITSIFIVRDKEIRQQKNNNQDYLRLTLGDRSGSVAALSFQDTDKNWHTFNQGDYVLVRGVVKEYAGRPQIKLTRVQVLPEDGVDSRDFLPSADRDADEMYEELFGWVRSIADPHIKHLLEAIFGDEEIAGRFRMAPAAKGMHHAYIGGLLSHTLSVIGLCHRVAGHYGPPAVNHDLLLAGAMLHDLGKAWELDWQRGFDYTDSGRLLGHIVEESFLVNRYIERIEGFPEELRMQLLHIVLSHHGTYEFGSPRRPKTVEALILHYVDDLDSKCQAMQDLISAEAGLKGNWTSFNRNLGRYLYKKRYVHGDDAAVEAEPPRVPDEAETLPAPPGPPRPEAEPEATERMKPKQKEPEDAPDLPQGKLFD
jgi:3'-5' exoribonuclease